MTRHPDIDMNTEAIPRGLVLVTGKRLQVQARRAGVAFGTAFRKNPNGNIRITEGLLVTPAAKPRLLAAVANRRQTPKA